MARDRRVDQVGAHTRGLARPVLLGAVRRVVAQAVSRPVGEGKGGPGHPGRPKTRHKAAQALWRAFRWPDAGAFLTVHLVIRAIVHPVDNQLPGPPHPAKHQPTTAASWSTGGPPGPSSAMQPISRRHAAAWPLPGHTLTHALPHCGPGLRLRGLPHHAGLRLRLTAILGPPPAARRHAAPCTA